MISHAMDRATGLPAMVLCALLCAGAILGCGLRTFATERPAGNLAALATNVDRAENMRYAQSGLGVDAQKEPEDTGKQLKLPCRYYRMLTDLDVPCVEKNFGYVEKELTVPATQAAVVLVDVWSEHTVDSHFKRTMEITKNRIAPMLAAARKAGVLVIHGPSVEVAERLSPKQSRRSATPSGPEWPPREFLRREGRYASFGRLPEPRQVKWMETKRTTLNIAEPAAPAPGDLIISHGEQMHGILAERKILHLFYAGFAANICMLNRDYGMRAMSKRYGYNVILLRDATTAIEYHDTLDDMTATKLAIREVEAQLGWSTTTDAFIRACEAE